MVIAHILLDALAQIHVHKQQYLYDWELTTTVCNVLSYACLIWYVLILLARDIFRILKMCKKLTLSIFAIYAINANAILSSDQLDFLLDKAKKAHQDSSAVCIVILFHCIKIIVLVCTDNCWHTFILANFWIALKQNV